MNDKHLSGIPWRYLGELAGAFGAYAGVLFATLPRLEEAEPGIMKTVIALAPVLPLILVFWALIRQYNRLDERMKRISAEAFSLGAMVLGWGLTLWGFGVNAGWPELPTIWVAPAMIGLWGLSMPIVTRKYR